MTSPQISYHLALIMAKNAVLNDILANDSDADLMLVINDGDGARLLMDVYMTYVSEYDFSNFPKFMKSVDRLLYAARGNKPFTHADRQAAEDSDTAPRKSLGRRKKKKASSPAPVAPTPTPVTASMAIATSLGHHLRA